MDDILSKLEHSYQTVVYGYQEPDILLASDDIYDRLASNIMRFPSKGEVYSFNNAKVYLSLKLEPGQWAFINSDYKHEPRYSGLFSFDTYKEWKPVTLELFPDKTKTRFPEGAEL